MIIYTNQTLPVAKKYPNDSLKMINFSLNMMDFALEMMGFVLKMMNFGRLSPPSPSYC